MHQAEQLINLGNEFQEYGLPVEAMRQYVLANVTRYWENTTKAFSTTINIKYHQ